MALQLFEEAAEATKELKKNKKKRASSSATGSTTSASPKGEPAAAASETQLPRPKSNSPIVEKVDSEVQFKVRQASIDEDEKEEEIETASADDDDDEKVDDECLVPVEITDSLKRHLEEDQVCADM